MFFGAAKDDWFEWFTPSFYLLSPVIGFFILCGQVGDVLRGKPFSRPSCQVGTLRAFVVTSTTVMGTASQ
jgi:hypothetical protein